MATISPVELLAHLQHFATNTPAELMVDASIRNEIATAAHAVCRALEKQEDVVARILLSQVGSLCLSSTVFFSCQFSLIILACSLSKALQFGSR